MGCASSALQELGGEALEIGASVAVDMIQESLEEGGDGGEDGGDGGDGGGGDGGDCNFVRLILRNVVNKSCSQQPAHCISIKTQHRVMKGMRGSDCYQ